MANLRFPDILSVSKSDIQSASFLVKNLTPWMFTAISCPHRSFADYYRLSGDFVVEPKIIILIINYLVILWSQSKIIGYMEKTIH